MVLNGLLDHHFLDRIGHQTSLHLHTTPLTSSISTPHYSPLHLHTTLLTSSSPHHTTHLFISTPHHSPLTSISTPHHSPHLHTTPLISTSLHLHTTPLTSLHLHTTLFTSSISTPHHSPLHLHTTPLTSSISTPQLLVDVFAPVFRTPKNRHLQNFYMIVPPLVSILSASYISS